LSISHISDPFLLVIISDKDHGLQWRLPATSNHKQKLCA